MLDIHNNYLMHFQVKDAKWGNRRWQNKDGSLTPEGYIHYGYGKNKHGKARQEEADKRSKDGSSDKISEKEQKKVAKAFKKGFKSADWDTTAESILKKGGSNDESIKQIRSKLVDTRKIIEDIDAKSSKLFKGLDDNYEHYSTIAAITNALKSPEIYGTKMNDVGYTIYSFGYDDGDQGRVSSLSCYTELTNNRKQALAISEQYSKYKKQYEQECRIAVDDILGKYGNMPIVYETGAKVNGKSIIRTTTVGKEFTERLLRDDEFVRGLGSNQWEVNMGADFPQNNSGLKTTLKESEGYANKLKGSNTYYIPEAVRNLNLGNVDIRDMSNSQWESLRKECNRLGGK